MSFYSQYVPAFAQPVRVRRIIDSYRRRGNRQIPPLSAKQSDDAMFVELTAQHGGDPVGFWQRQQGQQQRVQQQQQRQQRRRQQQGQARSTRPLTTPTVNVHGDPFAEASEDGGLNLRAGTTDPFADTLRTGAAASSPVAVVPWLERSGGEKMTTGATLELEGLSSTSSTDWASNCKHSSSDWNQPPALFTGANAGADGMVAANVSNDSSDRRRQRSSSSSSSNSPGRSAAVGGLIPSSVVASTTPTAISITSSPWSELNADLDGSTAAASPSPSPRNSTSGLSPSSSTTPSPSSVRSRRTPRSSSRSLRVTGSPAGQSAGYSFGNPQRQRVAAAASSKVVAGGDDNLDAMYSSWRARVGAAADAGDDDPLGGF